MKMTLKKKKSKKKLKKKFNLAGVFFLGEKKLKVTKKDTFSLLLFFLGKWVFTFF